MWFNFSPQDSPWQSTIAEGFAEANRFFVVITSVKILQGWLFPSNIYIQFTIFNAYFSTKLWFTNKRYHLRMLERCVCTWYKKSDLLYIFGRSVIFWFIPFLFVHMAMEQALLSRHISSYRQNSVMSNFQTTFILFYSFTISSSAGAKEK